MKNNSITTVVAVLTAEQKRQLVEWAAQSDRTVSAELRQILLAEAKRRQRQRKTARPTRKPQ